MVCFRILSAINSVATCQSVPSKDTRWEGKDAHREDYPVGLAYVGLVEAALSPDDGSCSTLPYTRFRSPEL